MNPNQGREAAYVKSRVKDLSLITNAPDYVSLFACITPKANAELDNPENVVYLDDNGNPTGDVSEDNKVYLPQLVRDVDTLDALFGDPRVDPETYKDLLAVRYIVQNGFACYVAKVKSGKPYSASVMASGMFSGRCTVNTQLNDLSQLKADLQDSLLFTAQSSIIGKNTLTVRLIPNKPYSINQVVLEVSFSSKATDLSDEASIVSTRVMLTPDTKNADLLRTINSYLGGDLVFQLPDFMDDTQYATVYDAYEYIDSEDGKYTCIANALLYIAGVYKLSDSRENDHLIMDNMELVGLSQLSDSWTKLWLDNKETFTCTTDQVEESKLEVSQKEYVKSYSTFNDPKYSGCFISDLSGDVSVEITENKQHYVPRSFTETAKAPYNTDGDKYVNVNQNVFTKIESADDTVSYAEVSPKYEGISDTNKSYDISKVFKATPKAASASEQTFTSVEQITEDDISEDGTWETQDAFFFIKKDPSLEDTELTAVSTETYTDPDGNVVEIAGGINRTVAYPDVASTNPKSSFVKTSNQSTTPYYVENDDPDTKEEQLFVLGTEDNSTRKVNTLHEMSGDERRGIHYIIKQIAAIRKNLTCIFTTPYCPITDEGEVDDKNIYDLTKACNWVAARGEFSDLFEYGNSQAVDYSEQAFYCEMYWSWLKWRVAKLVNGVATGSSAIIVPASAFVILNSLASYRSKGSFYPVAGDQGGILPDSCTVLQNPSTKAQRDKLISYRINPIFDTGVRGIQIYGNETLNPQFTDLSSAHIARTLVQIRSRVDAYSETVKFSLNDVYTWSAWVNYVSTKILEPIKSLGGLQWYEVDMGYNTTTRDEIAARKIRGMISLQFTPDLEIIDLEFVVLASSLEIETN